MEQVPKYVVDSAKKIYGSAFSLTVGDTNYVFRPLTIAEAKELGLNDGVEITPVIEEEIVSKAIIWPENPSFESELAGTPGLLSDAILAKSGLTGPESIQVLINKEKSTRTIYDQIYEVILTAIPTLKIEELEKMNMKKLIRYYVTAEQILILSGILLEEITFEEQEGNEEENLIKRLQEGM